jgi:hypothetical protein
MTRFSQTALLLLKLELLKRARHGIVARVFGRQLFSMKSAIVFKAAAALLFVVVSCLLPALTMTDIGFSSGLGESLIKYHNLITGSLVIFMLYFGLLVGGMMTYELTIRENEQLLSFPISGQDLVQYRVAEMLLVVINSCVYFFLPVVTFMFLALGWSAAGIGAMAFITVPILISAYYVGINAMLWTTGRWRHVGSDKIVIGVFLSSCALLVVAIRLFKTGYIGSGYTSMWTWLDAQLSYSSILETVVSGTWGMGQYALGLVFCGLLLYYLVGASERLLFRALRIGVIDCDCSTTQLREKPMKLGYERLNQLLRFLPLDLRALLTKDILAIIRGPSLLLEAFGTILACGLVAVWRSTSLADPALFTVYFSTAFIVSRLFVDSVGQERNNIYTIKQLYPSPSHYLWARARISCFISTMIVIPIWTMYVILAADYTLLETIVRLALMGLTLVVLSGLVTSYSAAFAEFSRDHIEKFKFSIHPLAMLLFWGFSSLVSLFFYKMDLAALGNKSDDQSIVILVVSGLVLITSTVVFWFLGVRRIRHYS